MADSADAAATGMEAPETAAATRANSSGGAEAAGADAWVPLEGEALERALFALMPPDAPPDHDCHGKMRFNHNHQWPHAFFFYDNGVDKTRFQVSCARSETVSTRLARSCYMKFEQGASQEEVTEFRNEMYRKMKEVREGPKKAKETTKARKSSGGDPKEKPPEKEKTRAGILGFDVCNKLYNFNFKNEPTDDKKVKITVSTKHLGDEEAKRIATELHARCNAGDSREELTRLRDEMVQASRGQGDGAAPVKKERVKREEPAAARESMATASAPSKEPKEGTKAVAEPKAEGESRGRRGRKPRQEAIKAEEGTKAEAEGRGRRSRSRDAVRADASEGTTKPKAEEPGDAANGKRQLEAAAPDAKPAAKSSKLAPGDATLDASMADPREDAPPDHDAWTKVVFKDDAKQSCRFTYNQASDGKKMTYQTTLKACGGLEEALRIGRLCYVKLLNGVPRSEVDLFKNQMYALHKGPSGSPATATDRQNGEGDAGSVRKKRRTANENAEALELVRKDGRFNDAFILKGRAAGKKNTSVNGVYAPVAGGFDGSQAYEKVTGSDPRVIFYHASKARWKIGETAGASRAFAWLSDDSGKGSPLNVNSDAHWQFFDGKDVGYVEDPDVQAVSCDGSSGKRQPTSGAKKASDEEGDSSSSSSASSGESDSEADSSSASSGAPEAEKTPGGSPPAPGALAPTPQLAAAQATRPPHLRRGLGIKGRVCAKMLMVTGLRCFCHFNYLEECPSRTKAAAA